MHSSVVKILKPEDGIFGSGIIISDNKILTAAHVVGDETTVEIEFGKKFIGKVECVDDIIAIISVKSDDFKEKYALLSDKLYFTSIELLSEASKWEIEGYITENLEKHKMEGIGIYTSEDPIADYTLASIKSGLSRNYRGLSGSPVILNGRIVGIIQLQSWDQKGELGISFSSIGKFLSRLPDDVVAEPMYINELRQLCHEKCMSLISKNKEIAKYIPEIFIEESQYKEKLRYFSLPILFINKIISDLKNMDFHKVNMILQKEKKQEINFSEYPENINTDNYESVYGSLIDYLKRCILDIEQIDKKKYGGDSIEERYTQGYFLNNSIKWDLEDVLNQLEYLDLRVLLLIRNAGQGKTNFVCDFTENFLVKRKIISLFFNAADFCDTPVNVLTRYITINGKYSEAYAVEILNEWWEKNKIPIVIVIDGLNENISLPNFENHILQAIKEWIQLPFLKIIMTTRCELLQERFGKLSKENIGEEFAIVDMSGRREKKFKNRIFEGYLKHFDVHIRRDTLTNSTYNLLANDTLLLRFFCEVNCGKEQVYMYDVYKYTLFNSYYENKKKEIKERKIPGGDSLFDQLVNNICCYMVKNKIFNNIPRDALNSNEIQLLDHLLEGDIIFKEDQIVKKGFMNQTVEVLSFTFDEFRDFCITRHLLMKDDAEQSFPVIWNEMCKEHWSILEGVEKYLFFIARTSAPNILPIIEKNSNFNNMYWENVWNLEDKDITCRDIEAWREQFDCKGPHRKRLIEYLLARRNKSYFKKATVELLFEFMDKISDNPGEYDVFIKTFFPISEVARVNHKMDQKDCVFGCDKMVKALVSGMDNNKNIDYYTFLKMSIYLYVIMPNDIKNLWIKATSYCLDVVKVITREYLEKDYIPVVLKVNLEDIYQELDVLMKDEEINNLKLRCNNADIYQRTLSSLKEIWL